MIQGVVNLWTEAIRNLSGFGRFCAFAGKTAMFSGSVLTSRQGRNLLGDQLFWVGTKSVPVVLVVGAFVGMVLTVQTVDQFTALGIADMMGAVVNLSVLRELGPVLAGLMLAGRVGGGLAAEIGTMRVTSQIDALRVMGCDPIRVLVTPRVLACIILIPLLVAYTSFMGIVGGYVASVHLYGVNPVMFWENAQRIVGNFDIFYGPIKSVFFGAVIGLIACYKGFECRSGAKGVGQACTESFVACCMSILGLDLFLGMLMNTIYQIMYGIRDIL